MSLFANENLADTVLVNSAKIQNSEVITVPLSAASTSQAVFIADQNYIITKVSVVFGTASSSGTLNVETRASGTAAGAGQAVLGSTLSLSGTANTIVAAAPSVGAVLSTVSAGQIVGIVLAGTMTGLANGVVAITMQRV